MTAATALTQNPYSYRGKAEFPGIKQVYSATVNPGSLTTYTGESGTITAVGAAVGDPVIVTFSNDLQGQILTAYVNDGDSITWVLFNSTSGTIDLASGTMTFTLLYKTEGRPI